MTKFEKAKVTNVINLLPCIMAKRAARQAKVDAQVEYLAEKYGINKAYDMMEANIEQHDTVIINFKEAV